MLCPRVSRFAPLALVLLLSLSACSDGGESASPGSTTISTTPTTSNNTDDSGDIEIELSRQDDVFTPNGVRVETKVGQLVTLTITSDVAGELHVHSVPEQEVAYAAGMTEHEITIAQPGVVEVESHDPSSIVLQLEVR